MPQPARPAPPIYQPDYTGRPGALFVIMLVNLILTVLTLGIYKFWATTRRRRYLWAYVMVKGEPFAYLGTGKELFLGFLKFALIIMLPAGFVIAVFKLMLLHTPLAPFLIVIDLLFFVGFLVLVQYAKFSGLRYRLARSSWRGIRFGLRGSSRGYLVLQIKNVMLNLITLGLYRPFADVATLTYLINNVYFGDLALRYRGTVGELQKTYYICWLLIPVTLGLSMLWYRAKYYAHITKFTRLGAMEFRCNVSGRSLLFLLLTNALLVVFSFGLAIPYTVHRTMLFAMRNLKFRGEPDFAAIGQAPQSRGNEGIAIQLGIDDIGDIGL